MQFVAFGALGVVTVCSVVLLILGRRYARGYAARHGKLPRLAWMFHKSDDPELESTRRQALLTLPLYLAAILAYLAATGPLA